MKARATTLKTGARRPRRAKRSPRETFGKLSLREITESKAGYSWLTYLVQGWREDDGRHGRKRFKTREEAEAFIATKGVELANADTSLRSIVTRLSKAQVEEAEGAFSRLGGRYALGEAVDYFLRTFAQPDNPVPIDRARDAFLDARERDGVRPRSLVQLRSTLGQFIGFATLHLLPAELRTEIDRVRAELGHEHAASLPDVIRALPARGARRRTQSRRRRGNRARRVAAPRPRPRGARCRGQCAR